MRTVRLVYGWLVSFRFVRVDFLGIVFSRCVIVGSVEVVGWVVDDALRSGRRSRIMARVLRVLLWRVIM